MRDVFFISSLLAINVWSPLANAAMQPCPFDESKNCTLSRDILNDTTPNGLHFFSATARDHRATGELNVYHEKSTQPYIDDLNIPGQIQLSLGLSTISQSLEPFYYSGEIMTKGSIKGQFPWRTPSDSARWSTKELSHGYLEVIVKMPKCDQSDDILCNRNQNPSEYNKGLWPSITLMPITDSAAFNGEIDIATAYFFGHPNFNIVDASLHFSGLDKSCRNYDCEGVGYILSEKDIGIPLYQEFHKWGFEWEPDTKSAGGGQLITGYLDNKRLWGPLRTDEIAIQPDGTGADARFAFRRGFAEGYYLIISLAMGGPYAGAPYSVLINQRREFLLTNSSMYIQSIKAYEIVHATCQPPANIRGGKVKGGIQLNWDQPENSLKIDSYQIADWRGRTIWTGTSQEFIDTHPDSHLTWPYVHYYLYSHCIDGTTAKKAYQVGLQ